MTESMPLRLFSETTRPFLRGLDLGPIVVLQQFIPRHKWVVPIDSGQYPEEFFLIEPKTLRLTVYGDRHFNALFTERGFYFERWLPKTPNQRNLRLSLSSLYCAHFICRQIAK